MFIQLYILDKFVMIRIVNVFHVFQVLDKRHEIGEREQTRDRIK